MRAYLARYTSSSHPRLLRLLLQGRKCRQCGNDLDLPSVHFVCGGLAHEEHVFHLHCVAVAVGGDGRDGEGGGRAPECPVCAPEQVRPTLLGGGEGRGGNVQCVRLSRCVLPC